MSGSVDAQVSLLHFCKTSVASFPFESFLTSLLFLPTGVPLKSDCLGSVMRVSLDRALEMGNGLEVEAVSEYRIRRNHEGALKPLAEAILEHGFSSFSPPDGTQYHLLHPRLAAQCGYSMESDPWGNTRIYTSLMACYVDSKVLHSE